MTQATKEQLACRHEAFRADVATFRFEDTGRFISEIKIECSQCALPFRFVGVPAGLSWDRPSTSIEGCTLNAPIEPENVRRLADGAAYQMPPELSGGRH